MMGCLTTLYERFCKIPGALCGLPALILLLAACFVMACDDEFKGPYTFDVRGPSEVEPETTETYYIGDLLNPDSYTWTVAGPAEIVGTNTGLRVVIKFTSIGDVVITITNGPDTGKQEVTVLEIEPAVSAELNGSGMLKNGVADTVFLNFPAPLTADPVIKILASTDTSYADTTKLAFSSGTLGPIVKVDAQNYYAIYTAGPGNGTPEALITGLQTTAEYGSVEIDSAYIQLYNVDNIAPIADLSYSTTGVKDSTVVTVTATFSEAVTFKSSLDSALLITFSGGGVTASEDGVASGSVTLGTTIAKLLPSGTYDVYFLVEDEAGNYSAVASTTLTMD